MYRRLIISVVVVASTLLAVPSMDGAPRNLVARWQQLQAERAAIEEMPLRERPNRPGHIYGNNVRRLHYRKVRVNTHRGVQGPLGS